MKLKMLVHYQDMNVHYAPEQEIEVDAELGAWLLEHRKAEKIEDARHLDVTPQFEQAEEPPRPVEPDEIKHPRVKSRKSGRGAK